MRITFVLPYAGLGGGMRVAAIYAQRLHERGHTLQVVSVPRKPDRLKYRVLEVLRGQRPPRDESGYFFRGLSVPFHVLNRSRPVTDADVPDADVVIATWWETAEWVWAMSPSKGAKVHFIQGHEVFPNQPRDRVMAALRLPMHHIVIARWLKDLMRDAYGDPDASLVENSVDTRLFFAPPRGRQPAPTLGFLYASPPNKGAAIIGRVIDSLRRDIPALKVRAFGAEKSVPENPLPPDVEFHLRPPQDTLRDIYASLDVWLCASFSEGFHLPPLEAMACRTPVVATEVGGAVDTIEPGSNGFLAPIGDAAKLAEHCLRVLTMDDAAWKRMSDAAYERARRYTWDDAVPLFEKALERAVERARKGTIAGPREAVRA